MLFNNRHPMYSHDEFDVMYHAFVNLGFISMALSAVLVAEAALVLGMSAKQQKARGIQTWISHYQLAGGLLSMLYFFLGTLPSAMNKHKMSCGDRDTFDNFVDSTVIYIDIPECVASKATWSKSSTRGRTSC